MTATALAATLYGANDLRVVEHDLGPLAEGMVRIAFGAGGVCGSDMHYFSHGRTGDFVVRSPLILGHEIAGTVAAIGDSVTGVKAGDRVAVNPSRWCGSCGHCRNGRLNLCEDVYFMGSASKTPHMQGGFASLFDATPAQCVRVPDHVPFRVAALAEPLAVCLHAVKRAGNVLSRHALIVGAGPIGLLTMIAARHAGLARATVADIACGPLEYAARLGADETIDVEAQADALIGRAGSAAIDIAFEASGTAAGLATAIQAVRRGGTVVQIGNLPGGVLPVPANAVMAKELDVFGSFRFGAEFTIAVDLIATGAINVSPLISAERPLTEAPAALKLALDRSHSMKVVLTAV